MVFILPSCVLMKLAEILAGSVLHPSLYLLLSQVWQTLKGFLATCLGFCFRSFKDLTSVKVLGMCAMQTTTHKVLTLFTVAFLGVC